MLMYYPLLLPLAALGIIGLAQLSVIIYRLVGHPMCDEMRY
jgi:hypothetical protein